MFFSLLFSLSITPLKSSYLPFERKKERERTYFHQILQLAENNLRVKELEKEVLEGKAISQNAMELFFSRMKGNYLVFYDIVGHEIFYQYRKDRFDEERKKALSKLIPGNTYLVRGEFQGIFFYKRREVPF